MVSRSLRIALCAVVGLFAGSVLGTLFAPNPTGLLAFVLAILVAGSVGGTLYRTDWLR